MEKTNMNQELHNWIAELEDLLRAKDSEIQNHISVRAEISSSKTEIEAINMKLK